MARAFRIAASVLVLSFGICTAELTDTGPPEYGDAAFYVKLKDLMPSVGELSPHFSRYKNKYQVIVPDPHATELDLSIGLDTRKYNVRFPPEIDVDGKKLDYIIIHGNPIYTVPLNENIDPFDRTVEITIKDPEPAQGLFSSGASNTYDVRILQPPDYAAVVQGQSLKVYNKDGEEIEGETSFDPDSRSSNYNYNLKDEDEEVTVVFNCTHVAKAKAFNGKRYHLFDNITAPTTALVTTLLAQCIYYDNRWTKGGEIQRTYVLNFKHDNEPHTRVDLHVVAEEGYCEQGNEGSKGFACRMLGQQAHFFYTATNPDLHVFLVSKKGEKTLLMNGIPRLLDIGSADYESEYTLLVQTPTGHERTYPVRVLQPAHCGKDFKCDHGFSPKPDLMQLVAKDRLCRSEECGVADALYCCDGGLKFDVYVHNMPKEKLLYASRVIHDVLGYDFGKAKTKLGAISPGHPAIFDVDADDPTAFKAVAELEKLGVAAERKDPDYTGMVAHETCLKYHWCKKGYVRVNKPGNFECGSVTCEEDNDAGNCCGIPTMCSAHQCPIGYARRINKDNPTVPLSCIDGKSGDCDTACCVKAERCESFTCHKPWQLKPNPAFITCPGKCNIESCCSLMPVCKKDPYTFKCDTGFILKHDPENIMKPGGKPMTQEDCCDPLAECNTYKCPGKLVSKPEASKSLCSTQDCTERDNEQCCEARGSCFKYQCPPLMVLRRHPETIDCELGTCSEKDVETCCEPVQMCDAYSCPRGSLLIENSASIGCQDSKCTDSDFTTCCQEVMRCHEFSCPSKYAELPGAGTKECKGLRCTIEDDLDRCCEEEQLCSKTECPSGSELTLDKQFTRVVAAEAQETCCELLATCDTYSCPEGFDLVADASGKSCGGRICTDKDAGSCCRPEKQRIPEAVDYSVNIKSKLEPELCVSVSKSKSRDDEGVAGWSCNDQEHDRTFDLLLPVGGVGPIRLKSDPDQCLAASNDGLHNGNNIGVTACSDDQSDVAAFMFVVPKEGTSGQIRFQADHTKCLSVQIGKHDRHAVQVWDCDDIEHGDRAIDFLVQRPATEQVVVRVRPVKESEGSCKQWHSGFWCDGTGDSIDLVVHLVQGQKKSTKSLGTVDVPAPGLAAKHMSIKFRSFSASSQVNVWVARKSDLPYMHMGIRRLSDEGRDEQTEGHASVSSIWL